MDEWIEDIPKNNKIGDNQDDNKLSVGCETDSHHIEDILVNFKNTYFTNLLTI